MKLRKESLIIYIKNLITLEIQQSNPTPCTAVIILMKC